MFDLICTPTHRLDDAAVIDPVRKVNRPAGRRIDHRVDIGENPVAIEVSPQCGMRLSLRRVGKSYDNLFIVDADCLTAWAAKGAKVYR